MSGTRPNPAVTQPDRTRSMMSACPPSTNPARIRTPALAHYDERQAS